MFNDSWSIWYGIYLPSASGYVSIYKSFNFFHFDLVIIFLYSFPWNQTTPIGYLAELCFHLVSAQVYLLSNGIFLLLFISICWNHRTFYIMFQHSIDGLSQTKKETDKVLLCDLIRFHMSIKKWVSIWFEGFSKDFFFIFIIKLVLSKDNILFKEESEWNKFLIFFSWFLETADVFSFYILIQLICSMILLASMTLQLESVYV